MRELGASEVQIAALDDEDPADDLYGVWPENWQTVQVFQRVSNCWDIVVGLEGAYYQRLIRTEIESTLRMMLIPGSEHLEILDNLRVMEEAARKVLNERQ